MVQRSRPTAEMRTPALLSVGAHVFVLVAAMVSFDFFRAPPIEPEPVMVDFVAVAAKAAAPKIGVQPPQPEKAKIAEETTKAPPPKTGEPAPAPEVKKPEVAEAVPLPPKPEEKPKAEDPKPVEDKIAMKPKEPEPPKVEKPPDPKPDPKPEVKKPDPKPVAPPPKPAPKTTDVDKLIDSLVNKDSKTTIKTPEQQPKPVKEITRQASVAPNLASVVTASEIEAVQRKIGECWNRPGGLKDNPVVTMVVEMNQDGTPIKAEIKDTGRYNRDPAFRASADQAWRAVMNPRCQPWPLSPEKYNSWRIITFNWAPQDY